MASLNLSQYPSNVPTSKRAGPSHSKFLQVDKDGRAYRGHYERSAALYGSAVSEAIDDTKELHIVGEAGAASTITGLSAVNLAGRKIVILPNAAHIAGSNSLTLVGDATTVINETIVDATPVAVSTIAAPATSGAHAAWSRIEIIGISSTEINVHVTKV